MAFGLLWLFDAKKKKEDKQTKKQNKTKTKKKQKNCVCLVFVNILGIIKGHLGFRDLLFL